VVDREVDVKVCVLTGAYARPSRTHEAALLVARAVAPEGQIDEIVLSDHAAGLLDTFADPHVAALRERVRAADLLIVGSPTMKASYSGLLKLFLDGFGAGGLDGLEAIALMTGAALEHALAVEYQLRPVLSEIGCRLPAPGLYLAGERLERADETIAAWVAAWGG